jgi:hypothetical protein
MRSIQLWAAFLLWGMACAVHGQGPSPGQPAAGQVNNISEVIERLKSCWRPPPRSLANPMAITVIVSFNRSGQILGRPKITFESAEATDNDRLQYRLAVMEALQRCTPMPFTETMAGASAGHPFWMRFGTEKPTSPATEKRVWLSPKIL